MTTADVEQYLANVPQDSERADFLNRMPKNGADDDDDDEIFTLNINRYKYADNEPKVGVTATYQVIARDRTSGIAHGAHSTTTTPVNQAAPRL